MNALVRICFHSVHNEFEGSGCIRDILSDFCEMINRQLISEMEDDEALKKFSLTLDFRTKNNVKSILAEYAEKAMPETPPFVVRGILVLNSRFMPSKISHIVFTDYIDLKDFDYLLTAEVAESDEQHLELYGGQKSIYDFRRIDKKNKKRLKDDILKRVYNHINTIYKHLNFDRSHLKKAYQKVKRMPWYVEKEIGPLAVSKGKDSRSAQLVLRWELDFTYYIARIYDLDGKPSDYIFDIIWRPRSFNENCGRLNWVSKDVLKFFPKDSEKVRLSFNVDNEPINFPYRAEPWKKPRFTSGNIILREEKEVVVNEIKLNY